MRGGVDEEKIKKSVDIIKRYPFSSDRKRMSTIISMKNQNNSYRLLTKGENIIY